MWWQKSLQDIQQVAGSVFHTLKHCGDIDIQEIYPKVPPCWLFFPRVVVYGEFTSRPSECVHVTSTQSSRPLIRLHTYHKRFVLLDMIQNRVTDQRLNSDNMRWWRLKANCSNKGVKKINLLHDGQLRGSGVRTGMWGDRWFSELNMHLVLFCRIKSLFCFFQDRKWGKEVSN